MNVLKFLGDAVTQPLQALINALAPHAKPEAQAVVTQAQVTPTPENAETAIEAVVDPIVADGIDALASRIPFIGPFIRKEATPAVLSAEHAVIHGLIEWLQGSLPAGFQVTPATPAETATAEARAAASEKAAADVTTEKNAPA